MPAVSPGSPALPSVPSHVTQPFLSPRLRLPHPAHDCHHLCWSPRSTHLGAGGLWSGQAREGPNQVGPQRPAAPQTSPQNQAQEAPEWTGHPQHPPAHPPTSGEGPGAPAHRPTGGLEKSSACLRPHSCPKTLWPSEPQDSPLHATGRNSQASLEAQCKETLVMGPAGRPAGAPLLGPQAQPGTGLNGRHCHCLGLGESGLPRAVGRGGNSGCNYRASCPAQAQERGPGLSPQTTRQTGARRRHPVGPWAGNPSVSLFPVP